MGDLTDKAFETDAILLNDTLGIYAGSSTPEVDAPDAPVGSRYYRSNGDHYVRFQDTGSGVAEDWELNPSSGSGGGASVQLDWEFKDETAAANPGAGNFRYDSGTLGSVTEIFVADETKDSGIDAGFIISRLKTNDVLYIQQFDTKTRSQIWQVTGTPTDNTGWWTIPVTLEDAGAGGIPIDGKECLWLFLFGGATSAVPSDNPAVQARRTTDQLFTTAFVDVDLDTTDEENDPSVVEHNAVTDRIDLKEAGLYWIFYRVDADVDPVGSADFHAFCEARVRVNDAGGALPGSECGADALEDGSLLGDSTVSPVLTGGFIYTATAGDFLTLQIQKTESDVGGVINAAADRTLMGAIRLTGQTGAQGAPGGGGSTMRIPHTWAISAEIKVPVGQTDFIVPMFVSLAAGQTASLVKARHQIQSGTSVTADLEINGVGATGFTGMSITTTPTDTDPSDIVLSNNDEVAVVVTAVSGTPQNMTVTIFIEVTG